MKAKNEEVWSARNACEWVYARVRKREREIWKTVELEEKVHLFFAFSPYFCAIVGRCLSASLALM